MAEVEQGSKPLSDEELKELISVFRKRLNILNVMYKNILKEKVVGDFYIGPHLSYAYLPDKVIFKRKTTETF